MHSNRDLATTTPVSMRHDSAARYDSDEDSMLGRTPEHAETGRWPLPVNPLNPVNVDEEPDEFSPGPSDVNGG